MLDISAQGARRRMPRRREPVESARPPRGSADEQGTTGPEPCRGPHEARAGTDLDTSGSAR